jgi:hypothetical protein
VDWQWFFNNLLGAFWSYLVRPGKIATDPFTALAAVESKGKQPAKKRLGGASGHGFFPGRSENPGGRPRTSGLLAALRARVSELGADGRTIEEQLANVLVEEGLRGKNRLAAVEVIFHRLEGRARQQIDVADVTRQLREKSDEELRFFLAHSRWPEVDEVSVASDQAGTEQVERERAEE